VTPRPTPSLAVARYARRSLRRSPGRQVWTGLRPDGGGAAGAARNGSATLRRRPAPLNRSALASPAAPSGRSPPPPSPSLRSGPGGGGRPPRCSSPLPLPASLLLAPLAAPLEPLAPRGGPVAPLRPPPGGALPSGPPDGGPRELRPLAPRQEPPAAAGFLHLPPPPISPSAANTRIITVNPRRRVGVVLV
jgi:hypothetical protein